MLITQGSAYQGSFFDSLLRDALLSDPLLSKVDIVLTAMPNFLDPFKREYNKDRQSRNIDISFGRPTVSLETIVRLLIVKQLHKNCSLRDVEARAKTDYSWKAFAKLSLTDKVPDYTTLNKWELRFGERSITNLHGQIIAYCQGEKIIKGKKLRTDTTVAPANIHYPTDAGLLADAARVIERTVKKIKKRVKIKTVFRSRLRLVKEKMREIGNSLKKRTGQAKATVKTIVKEIMKMTGKVVERASLVKDELNQAGDLFAYAAAVDLARCLELAKTLINQTVKALNKEKIENRIVSFFQPSMRPIVKGKLWPPCEFGLKVEVDEVEHNIISDWVIFDTNKSDTETIIPAVNRHRRRFGHDPTLLATDRGCDSEENQTILAGRIKRLSIPKRGHKRQRRLRTERSIWFTKGQHWRAGGEATISVLKRTSAMGKNKAKTECGYRQGIGWGIIGRNLKTIARLAG